ncbi:MAG: phosphate ABC transporter substrate-binding protein PstS [Trueperaceae bacterium]|nr:phosphate ABC transporter substrate-binding protein PstS [Trueperaceae bacterium]
MLRTLRNLAAALLTVSAVAAAQNVELIGAGASFPAPLITAMADDYRDLTGGRVTVNYQSIGSGGGIRQFLEQTIQFGATEAFLNADQLAEAAANGGGIAFNMPITLGDVVATYNVPGVDKGLVLDGPTLADIFLGDITNWIDPQIAALNPDVRLPNLPITVVHRSDSSGSTNIWTSYLSKASPKWAEAVGTGNSVSWPTGIGGQGNEGVSGVVLNTPGSIGYNSLVYAVLNDISYAYLINKSGNVIAPSLAATSAAADVEMPADTRLLITDTAAPDGYPAAGFSWLLVYENLDANNAIATRAQAVELLNFILWAITDGQELSELLSFSRIPAAVLELNLSMLRQVKWQGEDIGAQVVSAAGY